MKFLILPLIFFILGGHSFAQNAENNLVIYNSEFEKNILADLENATSLELLMSIGSHITDAHLEEAKAEIQNLKQALQKKGFESSDPKKQAKILESVLHGKVLKKYKSISPFFHIFFDGEFNCVSSSALYGILLDEFNIPYTIKELPTHVYVIMYPEGVRVKVETTAPKKGYAMRSDSEVEKTMKALMKMGVVTEEWVEKRGMRVAFNEHFFSDEGITLRQLTGLQYQNECINAFDRGNANEALSEVIKSQRIYPTKQGGLFMLDLLDMKLHNGKIKAVDDFDIFISYANAENADLEKIEYKYAIFLQETLLLNGNKSLVDSALIHLTASVQDSVMLNKIKETHYIGLAEYYSNAMNEKRSAEYAMKCLEVNMDNKFAKMAVTRFVLNEISEFDVDDYEDELYESMTDEEFDAYLDSVEDQSEGEIVEAYMATYVDRYPFLAESYIFHAMYFYMYAGISEMSYDYNDEKEGQINFDKALAVMETIEDKELIDRNRYGWMFSSAAAYYYRKDQYEKALKIVNEGLLFSPEHPRLLAKLKIIENAMGR